MIEILNRKPSGNTCYCRNCGSLLRYSLIDVNIYINKAGKDLYYVLCPVCCHWCFV